MSIDRFSDTVRIAAEPAVIYAHLLDPQSYIGLSPLIVGVRDVRAADDGRSTAYVAVERFKLGPFHWDNMIRVTLTGEVPDARVVSDVVSPGAVRLKSVVDLAPTADGTTTLTETIETRSPALLRGFVVKQASSVQKSRLAELARRFSR
ncbi:SRPBCC family protein [Actinoplanes bogorensis]|uniref:SRPBCC family protein n=1 Tax=Paractinoplanes bogorensis TaxID=1610840 RepID=A0ABS5YVC0_9ACTN|nr:SRPBCC family protein [Actinoplanes bogorensis]MBU2667394.1 SRPBCC family protein [Actinoplanes bogorensis]